MKSFAATAAAVAIGAASSTSAFVASPALSQASTTSTSSSSPPSHLHMSTPSNNLPKMSTAIPFLARPKYLDGTLAGDVGFDPLGFASNPDQLGQFREAEVKHARLAMLAAAGWPLSELFDQKIAASLGLEPAVDAADRAPSLLNGGLEKISPLYWGFCIGLTAAIDLYGLKRARADVDYAFPGDLGFDPLNLYPSDVGGQERMQLAEIKHGRIAMVAVVAFALQEYIGKEGVVDETPFFFFPLTQTLKAFLEGVVASN